MSRTLALAILASTAIASGVAHAGDGYIFRYKAQLVDRGTGGTGGSDTGGGTDTGGGGTGGTGGDGGSGGGETPTDPQNHAPVASAVSGATNANASVILNASFSDPDAGDTHTFPVNTAGTQGSVTSNGNGTFTYSPNGAFDSLLPGQTATDAFTYTVTDSHGASSTATVTVTITGVVEGPKSISIEDDGPRSNLALDRAEAPLPGGYVTPDIVETISSNDVTNGKFAYRCYRITGGAGNFTVWWFAGSADWPDNWYEMNPEPTTHLDIDIVPRANLFNTPLMTSVAQGEVYDLDGETLLSRGDWHYPGGPGGMVTSPAYSNVSEWRWGKTTERELCMRVRPKADYSGIEAWGGFRIYDYTAGDPFYNKAYIQQYLNFVPGY